MRSDLEVDALMSRFTPNWAAQQLKPQPSLLRALASTFGPQYYFAGFLKWLSDTLAVAGPLASGALIVHVQLTATAATAANDGSTSPLPAAPPAWHGYGLAVALFFIVSVSSVLNQHSQHIAAMTSVAVRSVGAPFLPQLFAFCSTRAGSVQTLIQAIYRKILTLSPAARAEMSTGRIVTLMSTDTARLEKACQFLHVLWTAVAQAILIVIFLYQTLGPASFAGVSALLVLGPIQVGSRIRCFSVRLQV
jgi:ATP-binding cassette subfamily C (CFTR/MRP) protein 1